MKPIFDIETSMMGEIKYLSSLLSQLDKLFSKYSQNAIHLDVQSCKIFLVHDTDPNAPSQEVFSYQDPEFDVHPSHETLGYVLEIDDQDQWIWDPALGELTSEDPPMQGMCPGCLCVRDPLRHRITELFVLVEHSKHHPIQCNLNLLDSIRKLDETVMTSLTYDQFAKALLDCAFDVLPDLYRASVISFDHEEETARFVAVKSHQATEINTGYVMSTANLRAYVHLRALKMILVENIDDIDIPNQALIKLKKEGIRSFINLPLAYNGELFGSLNLARAYTGNFDEDFIKVARLLASRLSLVIHRNRYEEQLRKSEENYRFLTQNITDLIVKVDNEGHLLFVNEPYCKTFGLNEKDLLGEDFIPLVHPDDRDATMKAMENLYTPPHTCYVEQRAMTKDGWRWLAWLDTAVLNKDGQVESIIGVGRDVTELKEAETARKKMEDQLQHTQKLESLGVLAGGIAHDFNNLLTGIMGNASLALLNLPLNSPNRHNLEHIELAAERAGDLCKQMLAYSGKGQFVIAQLDLSEIVKEIANFLRHSISKKARLHFHLDEALPAIEGDPNQVRQIIMNLITNAAEALGGSAGSITITTGVIEEDLTNLEGIYISNELNDKPCVYLEVADSGCGMTDETLNRIFDPFFTTKFTGRGLGLAAVLGIVRGHSGALQVNSVLGEGTVFRVILPSREQPAVNRRSNEQATTRFNGEGTILVIDDEEAVRTVARQVLLSNGFEVLLAEDGLKGLSLFQKNLDKITAVLLDLTMPQMDGRETFNEIRKIDPNIPVILTSGYTMQDATNTFGEEDLAGFLQKPFNTSQALRTIRNALENTSNTTQPESQEESSGQINPQLV